MDELWEKRSAGGDKQRCGWLRDQAGRVMQAMLQMDKIDIARLPDAYDRS